MREDEEAFRKLIGPRIVNGQLRYLSVSSLTKAAPRAQGCYRRWFYKSVLKLEDSTERAKEAADEGKAMHASIDHYLKTGEMVLTPLALRGKPMIPPPGPGIMSEVAIHVVDPDGTIHSLLTAAGIPLLGYIDMLNFRGINYGADDIEQTQDPPGTIEVNDWKWKRKAFDRYKNSLLKSPAELIYEIQMAGYGEWIRNRFFDATHVRLSHSYFIEQGAAPRKVTKLHVIDEFPKAWDYAEGVARTLKDVARETDVNKVPANTHACDAFGGCPHREHCEGYRQNSLDKLYGKVAADFGATQMGLIENIPQVPGAQPDMRAQLAQEEAALRAAQPSQQQATGHTVADAIACIESHQKGLPQLSGAAAAAVAQARNIPLSAGAGLAGGGELSGVNLTEVAHLFSFANHLEQQVGRAPRFTVPAPQPPPQPAPAFVQAPVQPAPAFVQAPAAQWGTPTTYTVPVQTPAAQPGPAPFVPAQMTAPAPFNAAAGGVLPPGAPASIPTLAAQSAAPQPPPAPPQQPAQPAAEQPKRGRGRPKNPPAVTASSPAPVPPTAAAAGPQPPPAPAVAGYPSPGHGLAYPQPAAAPQVAAGAGLTSPTADSVEDYDIYIDCRPLEEDSVSLYDYCDMINRELSKRYCVDAQGRPTIQDIRCAPKDSPLGFNGWKGATHEVVRTNPPPPGRRHLDVRFNEFYEIVADALRVVVQERGGRYTRSTR